MQPIQPFTPIFFYLPLLLQHLFCFALEGSNTATVVPLDRGMRAVCSTVLDLSI